MIIIVINILYKILIELKHKEDIYFINNSNKNIRDKTILSSYTLKLKGSKILKSMLETSCSFFHQYQFLLKFCKILQK